MNQFLRSALPHWLAVAAIGFLLAGCASLKRTDYADGPFDALMLLAGTARPNAMAIERISHGNGAIVSVRAVADNGTVSVRGSVRKTGIGRVASSNSHVDVIVLDSGGRVALGIASTYFPAEIPNTVHGIEGRSRFSVRIPLPLPQGATIRVVFDSGPVFQSQFYHGTSASVFAAGLAATSHNHCKFSVAQGPSG